MFSLCFRFFSGIFLTEDLTPTSDSDPPPPTEAESPPPLNSSDKDISGSLDVQKQPQQLQQPYLIEDFIPTVFVEQVKNRHFLCHISMHQNISSCQTSKDIANRVGKTGSFGPWSRVIVKCIVATFPFAKMILPLGDHFSKRTACNNAL